MNGVASEVGIGNMWSKMLFSEQKYILKDLLLNYLLLEWGILEEPLLALKDVQFTAFKS